MQNMKISPVPKIPAKLLVHPSKNNFENQIQSNKKFIQILNYFI